MTTENGQPQASTLSNLDSAFQNLAAAKGLGGAPAPATQPSAPQGEQAPQEARPRIADGLEMPPGADAQPAGEPAPAEPAQPAASTREADLLRKYATKDRQYQETRNALRAAESRLQEVEQSYQKKLQELEGRFNETISRLKTDPLKVLREHGASFGDVALASLGMGGDGQQQPQQGQQSAKLQIPDEITKELEELRSFKSEASKFIEELRAERQKMTAEQTRQSQINTVKGFLGEKKEFPLLNEEGRYEVVLDRVMQHVGQHGEFADDRDAEEILTFYAHQVESELRSYYESLLKRNGIKSLLGMGVGAPAKTPAQPARQVIQGEQSQRTPAPALTNELTQPRTSVVPESAWDPQAAKARAIAEMQALADKARAAQRSA